MVVSVGKKLINMVNVESVEVETDKGLRFDMVSGVSVGVKVKDASMAFREIRWGLAQGMSLVILEVEE